MQKPLLFNLALSQGIFDYLFLEIIVSISLGFAALPTAVALVEKLGAAAIVRFRNNGLFCMRAKILTVISSAAEKSTEDADKNSIVFSQFLNRKIIVSA